MATSQPKIRTFVEIQTPDGKKYYVEPSTKFSTYTFPADAVIFSNETKQIIYRPPGMNVNVKQHGDPAQCQPQQQGQPGSPPNPNPQQQPHPGQQQQQLTQQQQQAYMQQMRQQQQPGQPGVTPSPNPQQSQQLGQPGQPSPQQHLQSGQQQQQQPHPGQQQHQLTPQQQAYMQQMRMRQMQQQQMQQQQMQQQQMQQQQMRQPQSGQQQQQQPHPGQQQRQLTPQQQAYMQQMRMRQMQQQQMQQQQMQQQQMRQPQSGQQQQQLTPQQQAYMQQMRMRQMQQQQMQQQQMQQPKQPAFPAQQPPPPAFPSQQPPPPAFPAQQPPPPAFPAQQPPPPAFPAQQPPPPAFPAQQPPPPAFPSQQPPPPPFPAQAPPPPQQPTPTPSQQQPQQQAPPLPTGGAPSPPPPPPSLPPAGLASAQGGASLPPPTPPVSGDADPQQVPQQAPPPDILPPHIDSGAPQSPQPRPNQQSVNQRRPNSTNQNMLNSTNQRPNSINQGRPRSTTQGSRVLEPPYCGPPPFKLSQTHIPKTKELIQRYVPLILNMDLYFPPRRGHALYKNNSDPNLIGGSHSRHKSGELEFINLISETISYKSSDASEAEVNQLEEIASSPPPTPPSSAAEEQPSLPTPASEEQPSSPPPASEEQPSSPPPASEEQPSSPPPASEEQPSPPSSAAEEQPSLPTPATEEQPSSSPPAAEEQPSLPPPSTEEQPSPPSSAAEEPPPPHPPALAPAPKPKKPKPTKPTKPKHTETKEEIMSDGTKVQYIIEYEEEEEEEEAEEPTPDPAPTPEPAPTPDPEPTPEPAPAPAPVPKMFQKQEEPEIVLEEFKEEEECHEYAPVTFKATIDIKELVSMHFNLARSSNHDTIMNLCNAYSFEEFGKLNFRKFHVKGKFLRSEPIEALITYNEEPLYKPLLASVDESKKDLGNQISLAILTLDSQKVVRIINSDPTLIDEVYAQLIKYTSNCPNEDIAIKGWMTFLLISTLFIPTDLIRNYVISHMYKNFKNESCAIKMLAKFSFIRLKERICIGVNRHEEDSETMKLIPYACFYGLSMFHTSLYEIIWSQKKRFPKTPIPIPLYLICQALILLGLFRGKYPYLNSKPAGTNHKMFFTLIAYMPHSPVNLKNYALSNNGIDKEEKLKTVIDLLIYWLNTLTDSIIPASILDQFIELSEQNRFNAIIVLLPTVHFRTLEYLIGFLKHFLKYQKRTGMDIKKISEAFGPHIVVEPTRQLEEFQQRRVKKYAPMFCEYCLNFLDTSSLYPLNPEYITDKTKPQQPQLNA